MLCRLVTAEGPIPTWTLPPTVGNLSTNTYVDDMAPDDLCLLIGDIERDTVRILTRSGPCYIVAWALISLEPWTPGGLTLPGEFLARTF
jgi:hypothetical protein